MGSFFRIRSKWQPFQSISFQCSPLKKFDRFRLIMLVMIGCVQSASIQFGRHFLTVVVP
jgi:hypothetical protein